MYFNEILAKVHLREQDARNNAAVLQSGAPKPWLPGAECLETLSAAHARYLFAWNAMAGAALLHALFIKIPAQLRAILFCHGEAIGSQACAR
ncbi:hypothetical protein F442_13312 [Phytophthora nicotianae P10297]|uniref:Uncharacterized protein n=1 Tax=Phytophthora nicotianae P10297 TaxID=1317064 RepID=W2YWQ8_PHYNI|nr:hypothetical protein F442_13312 [Phytophthora nicotianae P10297]